MTGALLFYLGVRRLTEGDELEAVGNGLELLRLEAALGLNVEAELQNLVIGADWAITLFNWIYIWGHWPVLASTFIWLFFRHRTEFVLFRNSLVISGLIGLVIFAIYPVAPPRLLEIGMVDTVAELSQAVHVMQPPSMVNKYAALPSFHVGWNFLVALAIFRAAPIRAVRLAALAGPAAMSASVVLTANHYIVDGVVGIAIAYVAWMVAHRMPVPEPTVREVEATREVVPIT
ncbi:MAG: phosphatase PAP2 family protein [Acidimicrobiales bacterium]